MTNQPLSIGLNLGTSVLNPSAAYVIGLLLCDEQFYHNGRRFWQASIRHNPRQATTEELQQHLEQVRLIVQELGLANSFNLIPFYKQRNINIVKYSAGKIGIIGAIEQLIQEYNIENLLQDITQPLLNSNNEIKRAFLVGVFDGRSSYDKTAKFISLDFNNDSVCELLLTILNDLNVIYNTNYSRDRIAGGAPRSNQLRIKHLIYLSSIGLISPVRYQKSTQVVPEVYNLCYKNEVLPNLKVIEESEEYNI